MCLRLLGLFILLGSVTVCAAEPSVQEARQAMERATVGLRAIATEGGYLWRYSPDLSERWGEAKATATQIWIQPPGTPSVGMAFLEAYRITSDKQYLEAAMEAAMALAWGQLESGGWDYLVDFDPRGSRRWLRRAERGQVAPAEAGKRRNVTTYDDDNTQSALRFLLALVEVTKDRSDERSKAIGQALEYGLGKMLEAQYPNGAWPQRWDGTRRDPAQYPVQPARIPAQYPREYSKQDYSRHYTLNDNTQRQCILTMLEAFKRTGDQRFLEAAKRGGDFLVLAQLPEPQSGWAQQYNAAMEPAWARAFEPPAVCAGESAGVIRTLVDLYLQTGQEKYLRPIPAAVAWYKGSALRPDTWSRFYELGTNRPIYGDRDGKIHYRLDEISEERRTGYSWEGGYGINGAIAYYQRVKAQGREAFLAQSRPKSAASPERHKALAPEVARIIGSLDEKGRWLSKGWIETRLFIENVRVLCEYLESAPAQ